MTDGELQAVVNAVKSANGNGHTWWKTWGSTVSWVAGLVLAGFLTWHQMDKRLSALEDTTLRIERALGRVEDVVWQKR